MQTIMVAGAGKIGSTIAQFLSYSGHYRVYLVDSQPQAAHPHANHAPSEHLQLDQCDVLDTDAALQYVRSHDIEAIVSALPYTCNMSMIALAQQAGVHYFDLSEDVQSSQHIAAMAVDCQQAFVPQCGLAPGFVNIVAADLMRDLDAIRSVNIRCGALPQNANNALQYALTWSTDGLINECGNPCIGVEQGERVNLSPLEDIEHIALDGVTYEAFNTSGGVGSLFDTYQGKVDSMNYKSMRYPGHCEKLKFLMNDLGLNQDRATLKRILENAVPMTLQDVVVVYVAVESKANGRLVQRSYAHKFYPKTIAGIDCTAIQATTASGACAVIDCVMSEPELYRGYIKQEQFSLKQLTKNHFGEYLYRSDCASSSAPSVDMTVS